MENKKKLTPETKDEREYILITILKESDMMSRTYIFMDKARKIASYTINIIYDNELLDEYHSILPGDVVLLQWGEDKKLHCKLLYKREELENADNILNEFFYPVINKKMTYMNALEYLDNRRNLRDKNNRKKDEE